MDTTDLIRLLGEFSNRLRLADIWGDIFFHMGWFLVKLFLFFASALESAWLEMFKLFHFFNDVIFQNFLNNYTPLAYSMGILSGILYLYRYMKDPNLKLRSMLDSLLIGVCVLVLLPISISKLSEWTTQIRSSENQAETIVYQTLNQFIYDVDVFNADGWKDSNLSLYGYYQQQKQDLTHLNDNQHPKLIINANTINYIDITERYEDNKSNNSTVTKNILTHKPTLSGTGVPDVIEKGQGFFGIGKQEYYRYSIDIMPLLFALFFICFVFALSALRVVKNIMQMAYTIIIVIVVIFKDFEDSNSVKKGLRHIIGTVLQILFVPFALQLYTLVLAYISNRISGISYVIALVGISLSVVEGSYFLQELTGIEIGLKSIASTMQGLYHGSRVLGGIGKGIKSGFKGVMSAGKVVGGAGLKLGAFDRGFWDGLSSKETKNNNLNDEWYANNQDKQDGYGNQTLDDEMKKGQSHESSQHHVSNDPKTTHTSEQESIYDDTLSDDIPAYGNDLFNQQQSHETMDNSTLDNERQKEASDNRGHLDDDTAQHTKQMPKNNWQFNDDKAPLDHLTDHLTKANRQNAFPKVDLPEYNVAKDKLNDNKRYAKEQEHINNQSLKEYFNDKVVTPMTNKAIDKYVNSPTVKGVEHANMLGKKVGKTTRQLIKKVINRKGKTK